MLASIKEIRKLGDISTFIPNHWEIELDKEVYNWIKFYFKLKNRYYKYTIILVS